MNVYEDGMKVQHGGRRSLFAALAVAIGACSGGEKAATVKTPLPPLSGTIASAAQACADQPMNTSGTIYYVCDCQAGAASNCQAGDDTNDGTDPSTPWQTYDKAQTQFANLQPGDTIAFCKGGVIAGDTKNPWVNG